MTLQILRDIQKRLDSINREVSEIKICIAEELEMDGQGEGLVASELLDLPESLRRVVLVLQHLSEATSGQVARELGTNVETVESQLQILIDRGHVTRAGKGDRAVYCVQLGNTRPAGLALDVWNVLERRIQV